MRKTQKRKIALFMIFLVYAAFFLSLYKMVSAEPEGANVINLSVSKRNTSTPDSRQDPKGTITVIELSTTQQNLKWKAYVGNVSGTLVLRDADDYSIYEWPSGGSPDGVVYITRNTSISWDTMQCANQTDLSLEQDGLGLTSGTSDDINNTFSKIRHELFDVGDAVTILNSSCQTLATWVNNTNQADAENAFFQEVLLMDATSKIVYASLINQDQSSYRADTGNDTILGANKTYDFQAIVPDFSGASIATYYFYVEITG